MARNYCPCPARNSKGVVGDARTRLLAGELRGEFRSGFAQLETKLIRWMFVFWTGSTLTILGTMVALLRL